MTNQIDQKKIERLLVLFNLMQKNDNIMHIIMLAMRELKSLIQSQSIACFVLNDEFKEGVQGMEEASGGSLWQQSFSLENGKAVSAISNMPGEIKTSFGDPDSVKYGLKDQSFIA